MRSVLWMLLLTAGCTPDAELRPTWRETWEFIACTDDGGLLDARVSFGNTGVLAGQGRLRMDRWRGEDSPVNFSRLATPEESGVWPDRDRVRVGPDRLAVERRGWTLRVNDDDASAVVHLEANGGPAPDEVRTQTLGGWWTQSVPMASGEITGWLEAGSRGGALGGNGLLTWRGGDGAAAWPRRAVYVLGGADTSIGLDQHGSSRLAWGRLEGRDLDMTDAALRTGPDGGLVLDLRPAEQIVLSLTVRKTGGTTDPYDGLSGVEQQALRVVGGPPVRRVHLLQARVESGGLPVRVPAALVEVAAQGDLLPLSPRRPPR